MPRTFRLLPETGVFHILTRGNNLQNIFKMVLTLFAALSLFGCATVSSVRSAPLSEGVSQTFAAEHALVLRAAQEAVVDAGLTVEAVNKIDDKTSIIIGTKGMSAFSWGELVRVSVERTSDTETTVRVYTKRKVATNIFAKGDYSQDILSNIKFYLR